jgi:hypothetical protein
VRFKRAAKRALLVKASGDFCAEIMPSSSREIKPFLLFLFALLPASRQRIGGEKGKKKKPPLFLLCRLSFVFVPAEIWAFAFREQPQSHSWPTVRALLVFCCRNAWVLSGEVAAASPNLFREAG